jgi:small subunit ribosomal protein S16
VATKIKLMRLGKMRAPYYRIVVADARTKRDGRSIETIGKYHPKHDPSVVEVNSERAQYWLGVGAQPTEAVAAIFRVTGDWQRFRGEPAPPPMLMAAPKPDKKAAFEAASRAAAGESDRTATTPRTARKTADKPAAPAADALTADALTADALTADALTADALTADASTADASTVGAAGPEASVEPVTSAPTTSAPTTSAPMEE